MTLTSPSDRCYIWPSSPAKRYRVDGNPPLERVVYSERAGTDYLISGSARQVLENQIKTDQERARLTTQLINANLQGIREPEVTVDMVQRAKSGRTMPANERAYRLLRLLVDQTPSISRKLRLGLTDHKVDSPFTPLTNTAMAWSETVDWQELFFLLEFLRSRDWIILEEFTYMFYDVTVTVRGHTRIAEMSPRNDSDQAFVAMWLDDSMDAVYNEAIAPAIEAAGYRPYRIDRDLSYQNTIDDKIVAEIRQSRFMIADFTHAEGETVRGSVYFEAGLALGLGIPLIFTARKSSDLHFDTSHFLHIFWSEDDLPKLKQDLTDRILAIPELGAGPLMGNP